MGPWCGNVNDRVNKKKESRQDNMNGFLGIRRAQMKYPLRSPTHP